MKTFFFIFAIGLLFFSGCISSQYESRDTTAIAPTSISSFQVLPNAQICTQEGKPIIRLYSTTTCPHCRWVNSTFNGVMEEYMDAGKIVAYHWDLDIGNDQFTPAKEASVPPGEVSLFQTVNPRQSVPTYLFGCKYYRIGNAYETQDDLDAEAGEFKAVIEKLVAETNN
jgi:thiol-disulfide isomerase/thioredoxin